MTPRHPQKPNTDPETGRDLPKSGHGPKHAQGAAHGPQVRTLGPGALELYEQSLNNNKQPEAQPEEPIHEIEDAMILDIKKLVEGPTKIVTQKRKDLTTLLKEIEIAPKQGISQAISLYRQIITEVEQTPEIKDEIYDAIKKRTARLKEVEASLEPSDRVALSFFIDLTLKNLPAPEKKSPIEKPITTASPIKHTSNLRELITVATQLLEDAENPEKRKGVNREMAQRAVELALKSEKIEEWSAWGNNLLTFLPEFQKNKILTPEEAAKHFEKFIGYGVQKIKDTTSLIESLNWIKETKNQIQAGEKAELMGSEMAKRAIIYINQMQANLRGK